MLKLLEAPGNVVAFKAGGKIKRDDVMKAVRAVETAMASHPRVSIYAEVGEIEGMTVEALSADLRHGMRQLRNLDRFHRTAVVTREEWVGKLARLEGWLLPSLGLKVFAPDEATEAMAYACEPPPSAAPGEEAPRGPGLRRIDTTRADVFAFEVDGRMSRADVEGVIRPLLGAFGTHPGGISLLARVVSLSGFDVSALQVKGVWDAKLKGLRHVKRYAIVGGPEWLAGAANLLHRFSEVDVRHFDLEEEDEAWAWLGARPA